MTSYDPSPLTLAPSTPLLSHPNLASGSADYSSSSSASVTPPPTPPPPPPRLFRPYPLLPVALLDLSYSIHHIAQSTITSSSPILLRTSFKTISDVSEMNDNTHKTSSVFSTLAAIRFVTLALVCGASKKWRDRGGWVALACGGTLIGVVWDVSRVVLNKSKERACGNGSSSVTIGVDMGRNLGLGEDYDHIWTDHARFLVVTATMAIFEYLFFLLLLRLSPKPLRLGPLALRNSYRNSTVVQSSSSSTFSTRTPPEHYASGRGNVGRTRTRSRRTSRITRPTTSFAVPSSFDTAVGVGDITAAPYVTSLEVGSSREEQGTNLREAQFHEREEYQNYEDEEYEGRVKGDEGEGEGDEHDEREYEYGPNFDAEMGLDPNVPIDPDSDEQNYYTSTGSEEEYTHHHGEGIDQGDEEDAESSFSESSIIDLPPTRLSRIIPPASLSLNAGLTLAGLDESPVIGPLVRRSRSARLLGTSFGSRGSVSGSRGSRGEVSGDDRERGGGSDYGTFDRA